MCLRRNLGSLLTASNHRHLPRPMYKEMRNNESQEADTYTLFVSEMGFFVKCNFLLGAHPNPLPKERGGVCRLPTYPCFRKVKMWFTQGSDGDSKELFWNIMTQSWDQCQLEHPVSVSPTIWWLAFGKTHWGGEWKRLFLEKVPMM